MSEANRTTISFHEESTWGTTPACVFSKVRFTGESLTFNIDNIQSQEINDTRMISDLVQTSSEAGGGINFELSYGNLDTMLKGVFCSDWVGVGGGVTETITAAAGNLNMVANSTNKTITLGVSVTHAIVAGQIIKCEGMSTNSGYKFVTGVSGKVITVDVLPAPGTYTATATIKGAYLKNGTTKRSYSIERKIDMYTGSDYYFIFRGMMADQFSLNLQASAIVTGSISFLGKDSAVQVTSYSSGGTYTEAPTNSCLNAVANVGQIMEGSTLTELNGIYFQSLDFTIGNGLRGKKAIGVMGNFDVSLDAFTATGNVTAYFANSALYNKYVNATESGIAFKVKEGASSTIAGKGYFFVFPRVKFSSGGAPAEGLGTDITQRMSWTALKHATYNYEAMVCRFAS